MFIEGELARSTAMLAAIKVEASNADERRREVSAAKAQLATSGHFVTAQAIQLFGGIAIGDEHDAGLYFKRMQALKAQFGDETYHVRRFSALPSFTEGVTGETAPARRH